MHAPVTKKCFMFNCGTIITRTYILVAISDTLITSYYNCSDIRYHAVWTVPSPCYEPSFYVILISKVSSLGGWAESIQSMYVYDVGVVWVESVCTILSFTELLRPRSCLLAIVI